MSSAFRRANVALRRLFARAGIFAEIAVISAKYVSAISRSSRAESNHDRCGNQWGLVRNEFRERVRLEDTRGNGDPREIQKFAKFPLVRANLEKVSFFVSHDLWGIFEWSPTS